VADLVRPTAQQRGIALVVHGAGSAPVAGAALSAILINLLANAVRAATTTVQLAVTADEHGAVRLLVADDGPGFPPELAERLRAAAIRGEILPGEPGFGLGLSLVVDRIRSLRGHLVLARSDAAGSCLEVHLPPPGQE
jgi:signal transduction histidine kinase